MTRRLSEAADLLPGLPDGFEADDSTLLAGRTA